jgi:hypothetical protein
MVLVALVWMAFPVFAHASCDAVKAGIDAKIKANGVSHHSLDVVAADQADKSEGKVVGQCEGNKAIVYTQGQSKVSHKSSNEAPHRPVGRSGQTEG